MLRFLSVFLSSALCLTAEDTIKSSSLDATRQQNIDLFNKMITEREAELKKLVEQYNTLVKGGDVVIDNPPTLDDHERRIKKIEVAISLLQPDLNSETVKTTNTKVVSDIKPNPAAFRAYTSALDKWHDAQKSGNKATALEAADQFQNYLMQFPKAEHRIHALAYQAKAVNFAGEIPKAEELYLKAIDLYLKEKNPNHDTIMAVINLDLARLHHLEGKHIEAKERANFVKGHYGSLLTDQQMQEVEAIISGELMAKQPSRKKSNDATAKKTS